MSTIDILPHGKEKWDLQGASGALVTHFLSFLEMEVGGCQGQRSMSSVFLCWCYAMCFESLSLNLKLGASARLDACESSCSSWPTLSPIPGVTGMCSYKWLFHGCWGIKLRSRKPLTHWDAVCLASEVCLCILSSCSVPSLLTTVRTKKDQRSAYGDHWTLT